MRLSCVRSLTEEEDGNVVEHSGLVEVGMEHHLMSWMNCENDDGSYGANGEQT